MSMYEAFLIAYIVVSVVAFLAYIPRLTGFFYAFQKPPYKQAEQRRRIALVVPARNESKVIGDLFASIARQDYDREFTVNVIVKDQNDPTVAMALAAGAKVYVVPEQSCKGDALDGYFKALSPEEFESYDAFVIVDADGVLSPAYVRELNNALEYIDQIIVPEFPVVDITAVAQRTIEQLNLVLHKVFPHFQAIASKMTFAI